MTWGKSSIGVNRAYCVLRVNLFRALDLPHKVVRVYRMLSSSSIVMESWDQDFWTPHALLVLNIIKFHTCVGFQVGKNLYPRDQSQIFPAVRFSRNLPVKM